MKFNKIQRLIFVYNADTGLRNQLIDGAHKILSPSTYECKLCAITFGAFTENTTWKNFRKASATEMEFLHKNEFGKQYASKFKHNFTFPIVLAETDNGLEVIIQSEELNTLVDANSLINLLSKRI
ncbi:GTPase [Aurantibacter crassamenti]|uniref:GTPase n=1 Tax=Aurantibacter crassamenti TaxID=1837375 RepID=UPI0019396565|nr:GTPase [Aurantibacter crassamenti]MBM1108114.1 GTPase [Aurantibacter crassamenti]